MLFFTASTRLKERRNNRGFRFKMTCLFFADEDQYSLHPKHIFCYGDAWIFNNQLFYSDERFVGPSYWTTQPMLSSMLISLFAKRWFCTNYATRNINLSVNICQMHTNLPRFVCDFEPLDNVKTKKIFFFFFFFFFFLLLPCHDCM